MANRLAGETSPYLLQHQNNPVDWQPWDSEALAQAKAEGRPIFLSIGYSACHWCHVMEHESFENPRIAKLMNDDFICVKVDREERPDLDQIYMNAVQMLTGRGGWPMSVFLTPDLEPFYGGTYWPPTARGGHARASTRCWSPWPRPGKSDARRSPSRPAELTAHLREAGGFPPTAAVNFPNSSSTRPPRRCCATSTRARRFRRSAKVSASDGSAAAAAGRASPSATRRSRSRDGDARQDGGRRNLRSSRRRLPSLFGRRALAGAAFRKDALRQRAVGELLIWMRFWRRNARIMPGSFAKRSIICCATCTIPPGGFYSTEDADSEGEEGKFYVWTPEEIRAVLDPVAAEQFCYVYDVSDEGNFEGQNILNLPKSIEQCARLRNWPAAELEASLAASCANLLEARNRRVRPGRDDKVLTSWNGLAIDALAVAAGCLTSRAIRPPRKGRLISFSPVCAPPMAGCCTRGAAKRKSRRFSTTMRTL